MWVFRRSKVASAEPEPSSAPRVPLSFEVKTNVLSKGRTVQVASLRWLHDDDFCRHPGANTERPAQLLSSYPNGQ